MERKLFYLTVAIAGLFASCGESDSKLSSNSESAIKAAKEGFLSDIGAEMVQHFAELEEWNKVLNNHQETNPEDIDKAKEKIASSAQMIEESTEKWKVRIEEIKKEIMGKEIPTDLSKGIPVEIVKPFSVTRVTNGGINLSATIKLTKVRPSIKQNAVKMQPSGYYDMKVSTLVADDTPTDTISVEVSDGYYRLNKTLMNEYNQVDAGKEMEVSFLIQLTSNFFSPSSAEDRSTKEIINILSAKKFRIVWEHPFEELSIEPGRGDLGAFDLRGPVKKVSFSDWSYTFNEQGQLQTENGQNLKSLFPGGIVRDKQGRLSECNADGYGSRFYNYNEKGLPTQITEDGFERTFTYDNEGYVKTETQMTTPEMGDEEGESEVTKYNYTILEKDNYGNWIKRKDQNGNVLSRIITYFQ